MYNQIKYQLTGTQLSHRKGVMPNALWCTDIFGLEVCNCVQKLSSYASVNAWCNYVTDRQVPSDRRSCRSRHDVKKLDDKRSFERTLRIHIHKIIRIKTYVLLAANDIHLIRGKAALD